MYQTAWLMGLASSLHCVGMCGPLIFAFPLASGGRWRAGLSLLVYHVGRIFMYAVLGLAVGWLGKGMAWAGWQRSFSILLGAALLLSAAWMLSGRPLPGIITGIRFFNFEGYKRWVHAFHHRGMFVAGALNGMLPCGMVYVALAGAVASTSNWQSGVYMMFFGAGTLPALVLFGVASRLFDFKNRKYLRWVQPLVLALVGWMLLQRGWQLDLSLWDSAVPKAKFDCH